MIIRWMNSNHDEKRLYSHCCGKRCREKARHLRGFLTSELEFNGNFGLSQYHDYSKRGLLSRKLEFSVTSDFEKRMQQYHDCLKPMKN